MILAMENAGQLIEDEELREQIRTCGIGTSSTRAEILKKLENNRYISLNKKTQILTPTLLGEMIYDAVRCSINPLLSPAFTASWEKGLNYVVEGKVTSDEYMEKLTSYVAKYTNQVKAAHNQSTLLPMYQDAARFYRPKDRAGTSGSGSEGKPVKRRTTRKRGPSR
jgi:DNA topoisomerase-3